MKNNTIQLVRVSATPHINGIDIPTKAKVEFYLPIDGIASLNSPTASLSLISIKDEYLISIEKALGFNLKNIYAHINATFIEVLQD